MSAVQCKMCGGTLDLPENVFSGECPYCGSKVTFPKLDSTQKENLYARAEHFRHAGDFDKAVSAYEKLLQLDSDDPELYWGLVLSRFGIEYVEDPLTHERIPTCHRVRLESFLVDSDYLSALEKAGGTERDLYEKEAKRIAAIQKGILAVSAQEKPYDVFICYKETTSGGSRTRDSAVAQDIYYQLTQEGLKVFFARITLEGKLGTQYEPYIFAALNSAKAMLVVGSKKEYFEAVWVRNEWSRYLELVKKDRSRLIIPCYKDMDPYDLPEELSMFQALDMSKIGFLQDIVHGLKKVAAKQPSAAVSAGTVPPAAPAVASLLKRIRLFLSTNDFKSALEYCDRVLDIDPENAQAYVYQILASCGKSDIETLYECEPDFTQLPAYQFALKFGGNEVKSALEHQAELWKKYRVYLKIKTEKDPFQKIALCEQVSGLWDADQIREEVEQSLNKTYTKARAWQKQKKFQIAEELFHSLGKYRDSEAQEKECKYLYAIELMRQRNYPQAKEILQKLHEYKDSAQLILECKYLRACFLVRCKDYSLAITSFAQLGNYKDSEALKGNLISLVSAAQRKQNIIIGVIAAIIIIVPICIFSVNAMQEAKAERERIAAEQKEERERIAAEQEAAERERIAREIWEKEEYIATTKRLAEALATKDFSICYLPGNVALEMARIPAGEFMMGSPSNEAGHDGSETQHKVTISVPFYLGKYEVTQEQWKAVMDNNPSEYKGGMYPVENVSWGEAMKFCKKLNEWYRGKLPEGYEFSLPTEAQWEYACRAGTTGAYAGDLNSMAWYDRNSGKAVHPVGQKQPNTWGLYDMYGNVWEWCYDRYGEYDGAVVDPKGPDSGSFRVDRGGAWGGNARICRSAVRGYYSPINRSSILGFRVALRPVR